MRVDQLILTHFRNYNSLSLSFQDGLTIITGDNAQGKTNLLEAIFLLSSAKSHRAKQDIELIQWGQDQAKLQAVIQKNNFSLPLELILHHQGKIARVNHLDQAKLSQFIGHLNVVLFAPEDLQIIKGGPGQRRKFIDSEIGQVQGRYLQSLLDYQHLLKQRNRYLKEFGKSDRFDPLYFEIITDQLIDQSVLLVGLRQTFIQALESKAANIHQDLSKEGGQLGLDYKFSHSALASIDEPEDLKIAYQDLFKQALERERVIGYTSYGPHRDDLTFKLNDKDAQFYGSQGQQRTIILSLKLAEVDLIHELSGEYPVLLLDDVLSELDDHRQELLMKHVQRKVQTFLTTASLQGLHPEALKAATIYRVKQGQVELDESKGD